MLEYQLVGTLPLEDRISYLVRQYGKEIREENDWFYKFEDYELNIHDHDEDGIFQVVMYPIDPETDETIWDEATEIRFEPIDWRNEK